MIITTNGIKRKATPEEEARINKDYLSSPGYRELRKIAISEDDKLSIENQLDACYKGFSALLESGISLPHGTRLWLSSIKKIKQSHPKVVP